MKHRLGLSVLLVIGSMFMVAGSIWAQGLEMYAVPHLFALPTATTTRLFGMGGFVTCIKDAGFGNPAFAGTLESSHAVGRLSLTNFDGGLDLRGLQFSAARPLEANRRGWQVTVFELDSTAGAMSTPGGPVLATVNEDDIAVHYGCRIGQRWVVGIGMSPIFRASTDLRHPLTGDLLAHIASDADFGFRIGGLYQFDNEGWAGLIFDRYDEDVTATGPAVGGTVSAEFTSKEMAIGISRQLSDRVLAAIEWQELTTEGAGVKIGDAGIRVGVEVQVSENWVARLGSNDGALCLGVGAVSQDWSFEYAFINDWNEDSVGAVLGNSDTHQLGVRRRW